MTNVPGDSAVNWAAKAVGDDAKVLSVKGLHETSGPWWLRVDHDGRTLDLVLRVGGPIGAEQIATVAAALPFLEEQGLPGPRLVAADLDGSVSGAVTTLETWYPGSSELPSTVSVEQLRAFGAGIANLHAIPFDPRPDLPLRVRPTSADDHARDRRWAALYRASPDNDKDAVVRAFCDSTGGPVDWARQVVTGETSTPLQQLADERVREYGRPQGPTVFVHGDVWWGNTRWDGENFLAMIDWRDAGAGDPGVDLGQLRMQMAVTYGLDKSDHAQDGWERTTGTKATDIAYWDAVAALNMPVVLDGWPGFDNQGRRLDVAAITERRNAFLRSAVERLG